MGFFDTILQSFVDWIDPLDEPPPTPARAPTPTAPHTSDPVFAPSPAPVDTISHAVGKNRRAEARAALRKRVDKPGIASPVHRNKPVANFKVTVRPENLRGIKKKPASARSSGKKKKEGKDSTSHHRNPRSYPGTHVRITPGRKNTLFPTPSYSELANATPQVAEFKKHSTTYRELKHPDTKKARDLEFLRASMAVACGAPAQDIRQVGSTVRDEQRCDTLKRPTRRVIVTTSRMESPERETITDSSSGRKPVEEALRTFKETSERMLEVIAENKRSNDAQIDSLKEMTAASRPPPTPNVPVATIIAEVKKIVCEVLQEQQASQIQRSVDQQASQILIVPSYAALNNDQVNAIVMAHQLLRQQHGEPMATRLIHQELLILASHGYDVFHLLSEAATALTATVSTTFQQIPTPLAPTVTEVEDMDISEDKGLGRPMEAGRMALSITPWAALQQDLGPEPRINHQKVMQPADTAVYQPPESYAKTISSSSGSISASTESPIDVDGASSAKPIRASNDKRAQIPCRFFNTARGCRKGDSCPYLHLESLASATSTTTPYNIRNTPSDLNPNNVGCVAYPSHIPNTASGGPSMNIPQRQIAKNVTLPDKQIGANTKGNCSLKPTSTDIFQVAPQLTKALIERQPEHPLNINTPITTREKLISYNDYLSGLFNALLQVNPESKDLELVCKEIIRRIKLLDEVITAAEPGSVVASGICTDQMLKASESLATWHRGLGRGPSLPACVEDVRLSLMAITNNIALSNHAAPSMMEEESVQSHKHASRSGDDFDRRFPSRSYISSPGRSTASSPPKHGGIQKNRGHYRGSPPRAIGAYFRQPVLRNLEEYLSSGKGIGVCVDRGNDGDVEDELPLQQNHSHGRQSKLRESRWDTPSRNEYKASDGVSMRSHTGVEDMEDEML